MPRPNLDTWPVPAITGRGAVITGVNRLWCDMLGVAETRLLGHRLDAFLAHESADDTMDELQCLTAGTEPACPVINVRMIRADETPLDVVLSVFTGLSDKDEEWSAAAQTSGSAAVQLERAASKVLDSADTLRMIEFADVAISLIQEFGQAVTAIQVAGEIVEQQVENLKVPDDFRRLIGIIGTSGQSLSGQFRFVRHFVQNRRADIRLVRLADVLNDTIGLVSPAARHQSVQVEQAGDGDLPAMRVDPGLIQLALMSALRQIVSRLTAAPADDRRVLVMHRLLDDAVQEIGIEFRQPESQPEIPEELFENCRLIAEIHGGRFSVESPATGIIRCCLRLGMHS